MQKITKNTTLNTLLKKKKFTDILIKYNVPCLFCPMARFEMSELTIARICKMYNIDIKGLIKELNKQ